MCRETIGFPVHKLVNFWQGPNPKRKTDNFTIFYINKCNSKYINTSTLTAFNGLQNTFKLVYLIIRFTLSFFKAYLYLD